MASPAIPTNLIVQQGNSQVFLSWDITAGATSYSIQRSTDGVSFSVLTTSSVPKYLDQAVTVNTQYWYKVASSNGELSPYTSAQSIIPVATGKMSLGQVRGIAQWTADMMNSNFVTVPEWNTYINQSYFELYDMLVQAYGNEYYVASPYEFTTDGNQFYDLPSNFYKLLGVDLALSTGNNGYVTLKRFNFIARNRFVYPNITTGALGITNMAYRLMGNQLEFIPTPAGGQGVRIWFIPRMTQLLQDTDVLDGISGWTEYVIVDAARKAARKEESFELMDRLAVDKQTLIDRIQAAAENRDAGAPETISDTRRFTEPCGWGSPTGDGPFGGF